MGLTIEDRVSRLEDIAKKSSGWAQWHYIDWQKKRVQELKDAGMSGRQAKNQAWREAQHIDFSEFE